MTDIILIIPVIIDGVRTEDMVIVDRPARRRPEDTLKDRIQADIRTATVGWITEYRGLYYKAGLEFA
jgi:hypothetical protein